MIKMTYRELYTKYKKIVLSNNKEDTAVKLLIQELSNFSSSDLYLNFDMEIDDEIYEKTIFAINQYLVDGIPIQYILGYTYFYGLKLVVNKNVLIPRRETEELVDWVIHNNPFDKPKVLDIGTGSGAIALTLKANLNNCKVTACDISEGALEVAKVNSEINELDIDFIQSDIFSNIKGKFNILVSNPPYIDKIENTQELVLKNEPYLALFASEEGLYFYRVILEQAEKYLEKENLIVFEIPEDKDIELEKIVKSNYPNSDYEIKKDLQGKSRILIIRNNWR